MCRVFSEIALIKSLENFRDSQRGGSDSKVYCLELFFDYYFMRAYYVLLN